MFFRTVNHKIVLLFVLLVIRSESQVLIIQDSVFSPAINAFSLFSILLPEGYQKRGKRFSTIYLLHGFNGDHTSWFTNTRLIQIAQSYRYIIVAPDAKNSWYANSVTGNNSNYENFLTKDIIPFVDKKYRTKRRRGYRAIAGLSMGGYGAIKYGLKYPDTFFYVAGISPSIQFPAGLEDSVIVSRRSNASNKSVRDAFGPHRNEQWNENDIFYLTQNTDAKKAPYFYLSVGSQDGIPEIIDQTHKLAKLFRERNIPFEMHESTGMHDWKFWDSEIENVLNNISHQMESTNQ